MDSFRHKIYKQLEQSDDMDKEYSVNLIYGVKDVRQCLENMVLDIFGNGDKKTEREMREKGDE